MKKGNFKSLIRSVAVTSALVLFSACQGGAPAGQADDCRLSFGQDGRFKILQFTDVHINWEQREEYAKVHDHLAWMLDTEKPDLVVFTGDVVTGMQADSAWVDYLKPCDDRNVPFVVVYGNHDREQDLNVSQLASLITSHPSNINVTKDGFLTDQPVEIFSSDGSKVAAVLWCMDSGDYYQNPRVSSKYGWIRPDQVEWYRKESMSYTDGNDGVPCPGYAFFHIPLPEYKEAFDAGNIVSGVRMEKECAPFFNSGLFSAFVESGDVHAVFVGHDHGNDYVVTKDSIALCYGRFSGGKTTYNLIDMGTRVIELTEGDYGLRTWVREKHGEPIQMDTIKVDLDYGLHKAVPAEGKRHGLKCTEFVGTDEFPQNVEKGRKAGDRIVAGPCMPKYYREDMHGYVMEGKLYVPESGLWLFHSTSFHAGILNIDGWEISGIKRFQGEINLEKGFHDFKLVLAGNGKGASSRQRFQWRKITDCAYKDVAEEFFYVE